MKATRLQQIENRVNKLKEVLSGDRNEILGIKKGNKILGMTRLRRA